MSRDVKFKRPALPTQNLESSHPSCSIPVILPFPAANNRSAAPFRLLLILFRSDQKTELECTISKFSRDYTFPRKKVFGSGAIDKQSMARRELFVETIPSTPTTTKKSCKQIAYLRSWRYIHETENRIRLGDFHARQSGLFYREQGKKEPGRWKLERACASVSVCVVVNVAIFFHVLGETHTCILPCFFHLELVRSSKMRAAGYRRDATPDTVH